MKSLSSIEWLRKYDVPSAFWVELSPTTARLLLNHNIFNQQRNINLSHIAFLKDVIERDEYDDSEPIRFTIRLDGSPILLNGQHRLHAIRDAGKTVRQLVVIKNEIDPALTYSRIDRGRQRSVTELFRAFGDHEILGYRSATEMAKVGSSALILERGFMNFAPTGSAYANRSIEERHRLAAKYAEPGARYFAAVRGSRFLKLFVPRYVVGVGIATFMGEDREKPIMFWSGVSQDDGLRRNDPRKECLEILRESVGHRARELPLLSRKVAACWNAWFTGGQVSRVADANSAIVIENCPMFAKRGAGRSSKAEEATQPTA